MSPLNLQRNLVYTGITRGKKLVVLIGQRKALAIAVRNNKTEQRFSDCSASSETMLKFNCVSRSEPVNPSMKVIFMLAIGAVFGYTHKTAKEDAARIWPWRDAKLTKAVNDLAFCINTSGRRSAVSLPQFDDFFKVARKNCRPTTTNAVLRAVIAMAVPKPNGWPAAQTAILNSSTSQPAWAKPPLLCSLGFGIVLPFRLSTLNRQPSTFPVASPTRLLPADADARGTDA